MTKENQDAIVGRVIREHTEATKHVAVLECELIRFRDLYQRLGHCLHRYLLVRFDEEPDVENQPTGFSQEEFRFVSHMLDGNLVKQLCGSLRVATAKEKDLAEQKAKLGF